MMSQKKNTRGASSTALTITHCLATTSTSQDAARQPGESVELAKSKQIEDIGRTKKNSNKPLTHYCIVRADIPAGTASAMLIHAAGESSPGNLPRGTFAIALAAKSEFQLLALEQRLISQNIPHAAIR